MNTLNDPILVQGEVWKAQIAAGQTAVEVQPDPYPSVPAELKQIPHWVTWCGDVTKGKQPYRSGTSIPASTSNPDDLVSYQDAIVNIRDGKGYPHLGLLPTGTIFGVDIDGCRDPQTGKLFEWADKLVSMLHSYTEVTPSQTGLRPWVSIIGLERKKVIYKIDPKYGVVPGKNPAVEILAENYGTITGQQLGDVNRLVEITAQQWNEIDQYLRSLAPEHVDQTKTGTALDTTEPVNVEVDGPKIPHGQHDTTLYRIGCSLRARGWDYPEIKERLMEVCQARCEGYGEDWMDMVDKKARSAMKHEPNPPAFDVIMGDKNLSKQTHVVPEATQGQPTNWRSLFRNVSEMEQGDIDMVIDGVLQEGVCFFGATAGHGKTLTALSFARAITLGKPLFGIPEYTVKQPRNVIYLIPESGDKAFRTRVEAFRIPADDRFLARTISSGAPLALSDPLLLEAVREKKSVVILDTASRFLKATDENSATQNQLLVNDIIALRVAGAVCVIVLHHAKKAQNGKREPMTLDNMLRGTGDFGAMCDQTYGFRLDEHLYSFGSGPMEIDMVNLKDRERIGGLTAIRLAGSYKKAGAIFPTSYIDETGDFVPVDSVATLKRDEDILAQIVQGEPTISVSAIAEQVQMTAHRVERILTRLGWHSTRGGPGGHSPWHRDNGQPCPYVTKKRTLVDLNKVREPTKAKPGIAEALAFLKDQGLPMLEAEVLHEADRLGISDSLLHKAMKRLGATVKNGMIFIQEATIN